MSLTEEQITANNFKSFYNQIRPYLNGSAHSGFTPIGTVISVMGTTAPLNYLACDGTAYNISDYPELAAYFNQQFGASNHFGGNGTTTFAVPDLRGEFLRGTGTNSHTNQGSGANVGVHQDGTEIYRMTSQQAEILVNNADSRRDASGNWKGEANGSSGSQSFYTSRPTNTSVLYCIASKNIFMDAGSNYSTEEQVVGTWIDGKPIYQKTFIGSFPTGRIGTNWEIITLEPYVDTLLYVFGNYDSAFCAVIELHPLNRDIGTFEIGTSSGRTLTRITIQYTKTTD